jgi:hypothetical protein
MASIFLHAAKRGDLAIVKRMLSEGHDVNEKDANGMTALLYSAQGSFTLMEWLLTAGGARITDENQFGGTVWHILRGVLRKNISRENFALTRVRADDDAICSLLKVMVLLDDAPPSFTAVLSTTLQEVAAKGKQLRAHLPAYIEQQRALLSANCPLPVVLQPLLAAYTAPTPEDMWTDGFLRTKLENSSFNAS